MNVTAILCAVSSCVFQLYSVNDLTEYSNLKLTSVNIFKVINFISSEFSDFLTHWHNNFLRKR
jgi:hypothetical protein